MKCSFIICSAIIICSFVIGCDVNSAKCPDKGKTRKIDYGGVGDPGEIKRRRKRATDSKFQQISKAFGPYARLCNAFSLCSLLHEPANNTIPHIVAEFLNLEHSMMDDLLAFDPTATSTLIADLRNSLTLNETDLDKIAAEVNKTLTFRKDFNDLEPKTENLTKEYRSIKNLQGLQYNQYKNVATILDELEGNLKEFDVLNPASSAEIEILGKVQKLSNSMSTVSLTLAAIQSDLKELNKNTITHSVFESIARRIQVYNDFFKQNLADMIHSENALKLGKFLLSTNSRKTSIEALNVLQYLIEAAKNVGPPKRTNRVHTRAFVSGLSDLETHGKEMKDTIFEPLFKTNDDFLSCQKSLEPVVTFGRAVSSSHSHISKEAQSQTLRNQSKYLLDHLSKLDSVDPSMYSAIIGTVQQAFSKPPKPLDDSMSKGFKDLVSKVKDVLPAHDTLTSLMQEFVNSPNINWQMVPTDEMLPLRHEIDAVNDKKSYDKIKNHKKYLKLKKIVQDERLLQQKLPKIRDAADKLQQLLTGLGTLEKTVSSVEIEMMDGFRKFWKQLKKSPEKILEVIDLAKQQLAMNMGDQKNTLDGFHSVLKGQLDSISKSLEPLQQSKKPFIIDVWPKWADREKTENKLMSGLLVYDFYDRVMKKKTEVLDMVQKNGKVRSLAYKEKKNVPAAVFTKTMDPDLASRRVKGMYKDLEHFETTFDPKAHPLSDNLTDFTTNILFIKNPGIVISDWIEANKMLIGTKVNQQSVQEALASCLAVEDLVLDFASYRVWKLTGTLTHKLRFFMHLVYMKPIHMGPAPRLPKPFSPKDPVFIFLGLLMTSVLIWFLFPIVRWFYMKKIGNQILKQIRLLEKCMSKEIQEEIKIVPENFFSIKEMFQYRKKVRKAWRRKSKRADKRSRFEFRRLLIEERENGSDFETSIRIIAEAIQQKYIEYRGQERSDEERGNYFLNQIGNFVTLSNRLFRIVKNNIPSRQIWQGLTKVGFKILVDFNNLWCDDYQTELLHRIRGLPNTNILFWSEELPVPFKNLEMHKVWRTTTGHTMLYMKYQNFPTGFAPFELTPCQKMYEMIDEIKDEDGDDVAVACMDRDADTRSMIMPMIDDMMTIMTLGDELEDLFEIGELMAMQRLRSLDLVTTVQIEFCLYVCFKIINDESPIPQPMFNDDKTEFLRDLEDAWACSWLKNYEAYQNYYESQSMDRLIVPEDRDQHFYLQHKPKLEEMKESVIQFMERRKKYVMSCGKPDPYKKETKKEAEQKKKDQ